MAAVKKYNVKVVSNPDFCGIDVGGIQFAHGEAEVTDKRLVNWFNEHEGYEVTEVKAATKTEAKKDDASTNGAQSGDGVGDVAAKV